MQTAIIQMLLEHIRRSLDRFSALGTHIRPLPVMNTLMGLHRTTTANLHVTYGAFLVYVLSAIRG